MIWNQIMFAIERIWEIFQLRRNVRRMVKQELRFADLQEKLEERAIFLKSKGMTGLADRVMNELFFAQYMQDRLRASTEVYRISIYLAEAFGSIPEMEGIVPHKPAALYQQILRDLEARCRRHHVS